MITFFICFYLMVGVMIGSIFEKESEDNKIAVFLLASVLWFPIVAAVFIQETFNKKG